MDPLHATIEEELAARLFPNTVSDAVMEQTSVSFVGP